MIFKVYLIYLMDLKNVLYRKISHFPSFSIMFSYLFVICGPSYGHINTIWRLCTSYVYSQLIKHQIAIFCVCLVYINFDLLPLPSYFWENTWYIYMPIFYFYLIRNMNVCNHYIEPAHEKFNTINHWIKHGYYICKISLYIM